MATKAKAKAKKAAPKGAKKAAPKAKKAAPKAKKSAAKKPAAKKAAKPAAKKAAPKAATKAAPKAAAKKAAAPKAAKKAAPKAAKPAAPKAAPKKAAAPKAPELKPMAGPKVGDTAPDFVLPSDEGHTISLGDYKGKKIILYFYPKDDTPGCTTEACSFRDSFARLNSLQAVVLGVSRDDVESHKKFHTKFKLNFPLLSDIEGRACQIYGVWKEKNNYGKTYMGIERSTFLIGTDGKIKKIYPSVKVEGHVDEIMKDLKNA